MDTARHQVASGIKLPPPLPRHAMPPPLPESAAVTQQKVDAKRAALLLDEAELERFKNLIVFAKTTVESRYQGRHKSPDHGGGGEFSEYLTYEPGRPVQAIDWHVYARSEEHTSELQSQ